MGGVRNQIYMRRKGDKWALDALEALRGEVTYPKAEPVIRFCRRCGVHRATYQRWLKEGRVPLAAFYHIMHRLKCDVSTSDDMATVSWNGWECSFKLC